MMTVDGLACRWTSRSGQGCYVVLLCAANHAPAAYSALCQRLHTAAVRTIVIGADPRMHPQGG